MNNQCETMLEPRMTLQNFDALLYRSPKQCSNVATTSVTVEGRGRMLLCADCLKEFAEQIDVPFVQENL